MKHILLLAIFLIPVLVLANSQPALETVKPQVLEVGREFSFLVGSTDPDGDELVFSDNSDLFEITQSGLIKFTSTEKDEGIKEVVVTASDKEFPVPTKFKLIINRNLTEIRTDHQTMRINLKQNANITKQLSIINQNTNKLYAVVESKSKFITVSPTDIEIEKNSQKNVDILISPSEDPLQIGSVVIYGGKKEKILPVIITKSSENSGLGLSLEIPPKFTKLKPGGELAVDIEIVYSNKTKADLEVEYVVKDLQDNEIIKTTEQMSVEKDPLPKTKKINLPSFIGEGDYLLGVIIKNGDKTESAAEFFSISKGGESQEPIQYVPSNLQIIVSVIIVILVSVLLYLNYGRLSGFEKRKSVHAERIYKEFLEDKQSIDKAQETKRKLEKQIESLEKAYKMKIISEESYNKGKKRIEDLIRKINKNLKE